MSLIEGRIVCRRQDQWGEMVVADHGQRRSLYFGDGTLQSAMLTSQPSFLVMEYSQAMMCALLFCRQPRTGLLVGLGGGSLVKFLLELCPGLRLVVAEISDTVIELAADFFVLPRQNPRLEIIARPGEEVVAEMAASGQKLDLVLIDAFDEAGPARGLLAPDFLAGCKKILAPSGVFAINLWNRPEDNFSGHLAAISEIFPGATTRLLLAESYKNAIVFGLPESAPHFDQAGLRPMAKELSAATGINFIRYLRQLNFQNLPAAKS